MESCYSTDSSIQYKGSIMKLNSSVRRIHSTPDVPYNTHSCCLSSSGKPKRLFVRFKDEKVDKIQPSPILRLQSAINEEPSPDPDCVVVVSQQKFNCNANLLQEFSGVFREVDIPRNSDTPIVFEKNKYIYPFTFWLVYRWMIAKKNNTNEKFVNLHWVAQLYLASRQLSVPELEDETYRYLTDETKVKEEKAFYIFQRLERYDAKELCEFLVSKIQYSFTALVGTRDFLELSCDQLLELLYSDDIVVSGETEVFYAGAHWILHDIEERNIYTEEIMSAVKFHFMTLKQLLKINGEFPLFTQKSPINLMLEQAVKFAVLSDLSEPEFQKIKDEYLCNFPTPRKKYVSNLQLINSYKEFLHLSRRRRERDSTLYHNLKRLRFFKTSYVEEMENVYKVWRSNRSSIASFYTASNTAS